MEKNEIIELKAKLKELNDMYDALQQESKNTTVIFEKRFEEQELVYQEILKNMKSPKIHPPDTDDNESHGLEYSFTSSLHSPEGLNPSSDYKNFSPKEKVQVQTAETQTALAIDPQTSVKLSFISAGLSTYGNTIEDTFYTKSDHRSTRKFHETIATGRSTFQDSNVDPRFSREFKNQRIPATPPRNNITQPTPPRHVHYSSPNRSERYNQHIDAVIESDSEEDVPVPSRPNIDLNQSLSEIPTSTIPPKTPLKSILRTPIRAPATPLSNPSAFNRNIQMLSPAMSPIHADHGETDAHFDPHTTGMFDASDSDISVPQPKGQREESFHPQTQSFQANASQRSFSLAELQHLSYLDLSTGSHQNPTPAYPNDSILTTSTGFDTLHSMSLLDITSNTSHSQPAKSKKKSSRRKKISSSDRVRSSDSFASSQRMTSYPEISPLRHSYSSMPSYHPPSASQTSQMTSKFWRSRLGQRDVTSILASPKSLSVFS